jgi:hypothetical protein
MRERGKSKIVLFLCGKPQIISSLVADTWVKPRFQYRRDLGKPLGFNIGDT